MEATDDSDQDCPEWECGSSATRICIPRWVTRLAPEQFHSSRELIDITFESGSQLRKLELSVITKCPCLTSICIPPSVEVICLGPDFECPKFCKVTFQPGSKLHEIQVGSFWNCDSLSSIVIPASVKVIGDRCFQDCRSLGDIRFQRHSKLVSIGEAAFSRCKSLRLIIFPQRLKTIGQFAFSKCKELEAAIFVTGSRLIRIERRAFGQCPFLESLSLPARLEYVGAFCFYGSWRLSTFKLPSPSRLRALLDLPASWAGFNEIPDSVERLQFSRCRDSSYESTLAFGRDSRLTKVEIRIIPMSPLYLVDDRRPSRCFLRLPALPLKNFRSRLEFDGR
jgi:hypothetical protein